MEEEVELQAAFWWFSVEGTVVEGEDRGDMGVPSLQRKLAVSSL